MNGTGRDGAIDSKVFDDLRSAGGIGPNDFLTTLIDEFLEEATAGIAALKDAVNRHDAPALRLASHSLKGTSSAVGANGMAAICDELERLARETAFDGTTALVLGLDHEFTRVRDALHAEQGTAA